MGGVGSGEEEWEWYTKPVPALKQREDIGAFLEVSSSSMKAAWIQLPSQLIHPSVNDTTD